LGGIIFLVVPLVAGFFMVRSRRRAAQEIENQYEKNGGWGMSLENDPVALAQAKRMSVLATDTMSRTAGSRPGSYLSPAAAAAGAGAGMGLGDAGYAVTSSSYSTFGKSMDGSETGKRSLGSGKSVDGVEIHVNVPGSSVDSVTSVDAPDTLRSVEMNVTDAIEVVEAPLPLPPLIEVPAEEQQQQEQQQQEQPQEHQQEQHEQPKEQS
jgi:hypothetical protein